MKKILLLGSILLLASCSMNLYLCQTDDELRIYEKASNQGVPTATIRRDHHFVSKSAKPTKKGYCKVVYGNIKGYVYKPTFAKSTAFRNYWYFSYRNYFIFSDSLGYHNWYNYSPKPFSSSYEQNYTPTRSYKSYTPSRSTGGTVHVKGYYRKDGTYVRPHTRSAPRRR